LYVISSGTSGELAPNFVFHNAYQKQVEELSMHSLASGGELVLNWRDVVECGR